MGSLETGFPMKREGLLRSYSAGSRTEKHAFLQRPRSRFSRFLLFKKLDYLQWTCTVVVFLFFVILFQMFLPGSVIDKSEDSRNEWNLVSEDLVNLKEFGGLDFGEDIKFEPSRILEKFQKENRVVNVSSSFNRTLQRFGYRKPQLALVFADLLVEPQQLLMVTVATALQELGYSIQVYSLGNGPVRKIWESIGVPVTIIQIKYKMEKAIDWLR